MKRVYSGKRIADRVQGESRLAHLAVTMASGVRVVVSEPSKRTRRLPSCSKVRNHSPAGFNWGYGGSGPAQLALALCCDALGIPAGSRPGVYQRFKREFVAGWGDTWEVTEEEINDWYIRITLDAPPPADLLPDQPDVIVGDEGGC